MTQMHVSVSAGTLDPLEAAYGRDPLRAATEARRGAQTARPTVAIEHADNGPPSPPGVRPAHARQPNHD